MSGHGPKFEMNQAQLSVANMEYIELESDAAYYLYL